jgi:hypothetical protein
LIICIFKTSPLRFQAAPGLNGVVISETGINMLAHHAAYAYFLSHPLKRGFKNHACMSGKKGGLNLQQVGGLHRNVVFKVQVDA